MTEKARFFAAAALAGTLLASYENAPAASADEAPQPLLSQKCMPTKGDFNRYLAIDATNLDLSPDVTYDVEVIDGKTGKKARPFKNALAKDIQGGYLNEIPTDQESLPIKERHLLLGKVRESSSQEIVYQEETVVNCIRPRS